MFWAWNLKQIVKQIKVNFSDNFSEHCCWKKHHIVITVVNVNIWSFLVTRPPAYNNLLTHPYPYLNLTVPYSSRIGLFSSVICLTYSKCQFSSNTKRSCHMAVIRACPTHIRTKLRFWIELPTCEWRYIVYWPVGIWTKPLCVLSAVFTPDPNVHTVHLCIIGIHTNYVYIEIHLCVHYCIQLLAGICTILCTWHIFYYYISFGCYIWSYCRVVRINDVSVSYRFVSYPIQRQFYPAGILNYFYIQYIHVLLSLLDNRSSKAV